jgi:integrase
MKEIINQYVDHLTINNRSPHTIRNYLSDINQFWECAIERGFDPLTLGRVTVRLYLNFLREKYPLTPHTIMRKRWSIKGFYKFLREENLVARNPFDHLENIRIEPKPPPFLNETDAARLIDTIEANPALSEVIPGGNGGWLDRRAEAKFLAVSLSGHFKTGQWWSGQNRPTDPARDQVLLSLCLLIRQVHFGSPTPGAAFENMTVV